MRACRLGTALPGALVATLLVCGARIALAEAGTLSFSPDRTRIEFGLDSTLHRVEGSARLVQGTLQFDEASGQATGRVVIDARSAETGNGLRDRSLHRDVLLSERYPEIVFEARGLELTRRAQDSGDVLLSGVLHLCGGEHPLQLPALVERRGDGIHVKLSFRIPYVAWGLRDMSNFVLHVEPEVEVTVDAVAGLRADAAPPPAARQEAR
jgi:polyisoprenoid-binding protein YceI